MRGLMNTTFLAVACVAAATALASDTNILYLPLDLRDHIGDAAVAAAYEQQLEAARHSPECRSAELDPEGHWGGIAAGLQLGVRLSTNTFRSGEPIDMVIILRNTTTNVIKVPFVGMDSMDLFVLKAKDPLSATNRSLWLSHSGGRPIALPPRNQTKYWPYRLTDIFDLSAPGAYHILAKCRKFKGPYADWPGITSGTAELTIVEAARR
jgi:hypothetical protein